MEYCKSTGRPDSTPPASGPLPAENLPEHWSSAEEGIAFFVDDTLICSTGDYIVASDLGQYDALMSGRLGLYGGDGEVTFQNASYNIYDEGGDNWSYYHGTDENGQRSGGDVLIDWREDALKDQAFRDPKVFHYG